MKPIVTTICAAVASHYYSSVDEIASRARNRSAAQARAVAMYVVRTKLGLSWHEVGREFERDHSTAMHAHREILKRMGDGRVVAAVRAGELVVEEWKV